ncbi:hypothetical protein [Acetivibrio sp. MSJd-27]|mgnify:CR=1 FL=1|jgi:hypothetical protein|uniref:hypothetical protein n=1 Tax=Acetivibrio sp. MSJd-27 TaxID=2841523 RepID=UPI0015A903B1|nr:hypothetical protein [Acetivibrio sp. MSJd-27]MBU5450727.1 hypothetical protein [Acetivibrio sp. MSJd-27]
MYPQLEASLWKIGKSKYEFAKDLGISYHSFLRKLKGYSYFTLDEALAIQQFLNDGKSVEELFQKR